MDLSECPCQEASHLSRETFIPCGAPGSKLVWHQKDCRAYVMCAPCADHNITNRGGVPLQAEEVDAGVAPGVDDLKLSAIPVFPEEEDEMKTALKFTLALIAIHATTLERKTKLFKGPEMAPMSLAFARGCLNAMVDKAAKDGATAEQKAILAMFESEAKRLAEQDMQDMQEFYDANPDTTH